MLASHDRWSLQHTTRLSGLIQLSRTSPSGGDTALHLLECAPVRLQISPVPRARPPAMLTVSPTRPQVRLAMLYALRFESDTPRVRQMLDYLATAGVRER